MRDHSFCQDNLRNYVCGNYFIFLRVEQRAASELSVLNLPTPLWGRSGAQWVISFMGHKALRQSPYRIMAAIRCLFVHMIEWSFDAGKTTLCAHLMKLSLNRTHEEASLLEWNWCRLLHFIISFQPGCSRHQFFSVSISLHLARNITDRRVQPIAIQSAILSPCRLWGHLLFAWWEAGVASEG